MLRCVIFMLIGGLWPLAVLAQDLESLRNRAEQDPAALARLQRAASARDAKAAFYLGTLYSPLITRQEHTVVKGWPQTLHWYRQAARLGCARADFDLGLVYEKGLGVAKNTQRAAVYFSRMAAIARIKTAPPSSASSAVGQHTGIHRD
ncbi:SEL1-like repeat protein [Acidithiobacillus ferriphilus]|uniref:sel1 repeat family protein n=1 Tax=Acidithiobacillus ferriphilus TaxID=1689834 RepID=UPI00232C9BCF|nr:sel1 repeat family protein [Acidithiobacillus ferriphilus]WCE93279.1 sel1 repeat family protein [Acidithiobacillus ferriphilus]